MTSRSKVPLLLLLVAGAWLSVVTESQAQWSAPIQQVMPDNVRIVEWSWNSDQGTAKIGPPATPTLITELTAPPAAIPTNQFGYWDKTQGDFQVRVGAHPAIPTNEFFFMFRFDTQTGNAWFIDAVKPTPPQTTLTWKFIGGSPVPAGAARGAYAFTIVTADNSSSPSLHITRRNVNTGKVWTSKEGLDWDAPFTPGQIPPVAQNTNPAGTFKLTIKNPNANPQAPLFWIDRATGNHSGPPGTAQATGTAYTNIGAGVDYIQDSFPGNKWEVVVNGLTLHFDMPNANATWILPVAPTVPANVGNGLNNIGRPLTPLEQALLDQLKAMQQPQTIRVIHLPPPPLVFTGFWPPPYGHVYGCPFMAPPPSYCYHGF